MGSFHRNGTEAYSESAMSCQNHQGVSTSNFEVSMEMDGEQAAVAENSSYPRKKSKDIVTSKISTFRGIGYWNRPLGLLPSALMSFPLENGQSLSEPLPQNRRVKNCALNQYSYYTERCAFPYYTEGDRGSSCYRAQGVLYGPRDGDRVNVELAGYGDGSLRAYQSLPPDICCVRHVVALPGLFHKSPVSSECSSLYTKHSTSCQNWYIEEWRNGIPKLSGSSGRVLDHSENSSSSTLTSLKKEYLLFHPAFEDPTVQAITPLLHGHAFSKIIQRLSPIPNDLPVDVKVALYFIVGLAHYKLSNLEQAKLHLIECILSHCSTLGASGEADMGLCYIYLGDCEFSLQHYTKAAEYYSQAAHLYSPLNNVALVFRLTPPSISTVHAKCGSALRHAQKSVDAVVQYRLAIEKAETDKDRLTANTSLGNLYQSVGENASALEHYKESIKLSEKLDDYVSLGWAHGNLGNAYLGLFQKDKALYHLKKSLDLTAVHEPTPQAIGRTYNNLGTAYQSLGDLDKAQEHYDLALSQAVHGNDTAGQARVYGNIGNVFMLRKNYKEAIPHYAEVLRLSKDRSTLSTAHHNRGCAYYEWAEAKMEALSTAEGQQCYFHGPGFETSPRPVVIPEIASYYQKGCDDLQKVVHFHEENLDNIKGSSQGLNLSISLFETNSRTFHRLQDCLVSLGNYTEALLVAEQSRARTLGELMLKRKGWSLSLPLSSPLQFEQVVATVANRTHPVLYLSYTGARLLGWVFMPQDGDVHINMFEVPLKDDQFDGKSFDYHLRYSLAESLIEKSFEMYRKIDYDANSSKPVQNLYNLIAEPLITVIMKHSNFMEIDKITIISDSYSALVPYSSLHHFDKGFLGDRIRFQLMPSLLTMSVLDQWPAANVVHLPSDAHNMCIAGNPTIPQFTYEGEVWNLGKLPHAKWEAEWVAHIIKTTPIIEKQATKSAILMRIQNAKVIHLATHGSASAGFMAFGAMVSLGRDSVADGDDVLLYPEDVEQLNISPALVVLSSCDSSRGAVKADGIQGMARAFILAGAQAVLTTLWRVPDESASIFMQFFYQYMMDGLESTRALQKAILSVRCFSKYSQYIHWSGYQLTGRDVHFECSTANTDSTLQQRLGVKSVFPRLPIIKDLESALVKDPCYPTDVQILSGCTGLKSSEIVTDFIHGCHEHFRGGVFWISCCCQEFVSAGVYNIEKVYPNLEDLELSTLPPILLVLDRLTTLPDSEEGDDFKLLWKLMSSRSTHCVVLWTHNQPFKDELVRAIDLKLLRGCKIHTIDPLTTIQSTQRTVYTLEREVDLGPNKFDQDILEELTEFTAGSPILVDITSQLILFWLKKDISSSHEGAMSNLHFKLNEFSKSIHLNTPACEELRDQEDQEWNTRTVYDSWESIHQIIRSFQLPFREKFLLNCLSIFGCCPIPVSLVTALSSTLCESLEHSHFMLSPQQNLASKNFILVYPSLVRPSLDPISAGEEFVYLPQYIADCLWSSLEEEDKRFAIATCGRVVKSLSSSTQLCCSKYILLGIAKMLIDTIVLHLNLVGQECLDEMTQECLDEMTRVYWTLFSRED